MIGFITNVIIFLLSTKMFKVFKRSGVSERFKCLYEKPAGGEHRVRNEVRVDVCMTSKIPVCSFPSLEGQTKVSLIEISLFFLTDSPFITATECS